MGKENSAMVQTVEFDKNQTTYTEYHKWKNKVDVKA